MRIISKTKDYYDGLQSLGYDPDLCYVRKPVKEYGDFFTADILSTIYINAYRNLEIEFFLVGFCGELYIGLKLIYGFYRKKYICYSIEDVDKVILNIDDHKITDNYYRGRKKMYIFSDMFYRKTLKHHYFSKDFLKIAYTYSRKFLFNESNKIQKYDDVKNTFIDKKVPVFIIEFHNRYQQVRTLNPTLKEYNFQKVKDAYTAYQEIAQYISGVLGENNPEIPEISDKDKRDKRGFDEWSFKTRKK